MNIIIRDLLHTPHRILGVATSQGGVEFGSVNISVLKKDPLAIEVPK